MVDPATILAHPKNWRTHGPEQRAALIAELDRVGFVQSVVVNRTTGHLVDGHLRVEVAAERGVGTIPVVYVELSTEEEARVLVALDPLGSMAGTNDALLQDLLDGLDLENRALEQHLVSFMAGGKPGRTEPDDVPVVDPGSVYVKPGDLWLLGDHRLLCGDSTSAADVGRLMDGARADCVFTDPPYGVDYDGGAKRRDKLEGDHAGTAIYADSLPHLRAAAADHASLYLWYADAHAAAAAAAAAAAGYVITAQIIWVKNNAQFVTAAHYKGKHEPCYFAHRKGKTAKWTGPNNEVTVWEYDRAQSNDYHPTQKPVALAERALGNSSATGDIVLDLFSGSGSTLIAAETLGRRCYAMELEPRYVQVAIERWQAFTGREAIRG